MITITKAIVDGYVEKLSSATGLYKDIIEDLGGGDGRSVQLSNIEVEREARRALEDIREKGKWLMNTMDSLINTLPPEATIDPPPSDDK